MREVHITIPEIGLIAATRAAAGVGLGLLLADYLEPQQRRAVGWTLFLTSAFSTVPLVIDVLGKRMPRVGEQC